MGTVYLDTIEIGSFTPDTEGTTGIIYLDIDNIGTFTLALNGNVLLDTDIIGTYVATPGGVPPTPPTPPSEGLQDARYRTRVYLNTYLIAANLTKDDNSSYASYITVFHDPDYPIIKVFKGTKNIDLIFSVDTPETTPLINPTTRKGYGYIERVPVKIFTINKSGITGTKLRWKAELELRRIAENYPLGSIREWERMKPNEKNYGSTILYSVEYVLSYKRGTA